MTEKSSSNSINRGLPGPGSRGRMGFEKPKNTKKVFKWLFQYIRNQWFLFLIIILMVFVSSACSLAGSYFIKPLINNYILPKDFHGLAIALLILGFIYLIGITTSALQNQLSVRLSQKIVSRLRHDLFAAIELLPLKYFDNHTHGELMSRFTNDIDNVQTMFEQSITQLISSFIIFIGSIVLMLIISPFLFLIVVIFISLMLFLSTKIGSKTRIYFQRQQKTLGQLNGFIEESISGLKEIKVFCHEDQSIKKFEELNEEFRQVGSKANFFAGIIMPIMVNLNNICYAIIAIIGGILTAISRFDLGSLAAFLQYSRQIGQPINQITGQINNILAALAGAERVFEVIQEEVEIDNGKITLKSSKGFISFQKINFGYEDSKLVLKNISLEAKPGQTIALVGSTGAGKTTITNLINRFYEIQSGNITIDNIDIRNIKKESLRHTLGMVLQDTHLFTGTVIDNIRYGRLDATDENCIAAAKIANANSFISRLPQGYKTIIESDGVNLSQGQRQLIALARVCVADPKIMILDEATSSIDTRTEKLIEKGMDHLISSRTVFVIAHRLSTVRNANKILVIEKGEIIEQGNHDELLSQKGRYYQLYTGKNTLQ